ncbi:MAG: sigma-70 family RNA polymerase sigma factor [Gemmatimonadetes bacterium]|nr:sigma-70 family RNA polymerase sigma factor [Gemmatimonadota bacterium]
MPRWPTRLKELSKETGRGRLSRRSSSEAWSILYLALDAAFARQAVRYRSVRPEDVEDLVADKALDLARRFECGEWVVEGRHEGEIVRFVDTVARNGIIDHLRTAGRLLLGEEEKLESAPASDSAAPRPSSRAEQAEFGTALRGCLERLSARDRTIWFFRTFYDLSSRDIARHPEIGIKTPHVDVILQRTRASLRDCLARKGHDREDLLPGTFVALWQRFRLPSSPGGAP